MTLIGLLTATLETGPVGLPTCGALCGADPGGFALCSCQ